MTSEVKTLALLWEYGQAAIRRAEKIKQDKGQEHHIRDRAQAQADSWRAMMNLIVDGGHEFEDTGYVMGGARTAQGAYQQMLCSDHREVMEFKGQNGEGRAFECPVGCRWEHDWRHVWTEFPRRTGQTPYTQPERSLPFTAAEQTAIDEAFDEDPRP